MSDTHCAGTCCDQQSARVMNNLYFSLMIARVLKHNISPKNRNKSTYTKSHWKFSLKASVLSFLCSWYFCEKQDRTQRPPATSRSLNFSVYCTMTKQIFNTAASKLPRYSPLMHSTAERSSWYRRWVPLVCSYLLFPHRHCHVFACASPQCSFFYGGKYFWYTVERFRGTGEAGPIDFFCNISGVNRNQFTPKFVVAHYRMRNWALTQAPGWRHHKQAGLTALSACPVGAHLHVSSTRHLVVDVELWGRGVRCFLFWKWSSFQGKITQSCALKPSPERPHQLLLFRFIQ